ncbi:bile acid:sodium symporter [Teichococcus oryzae]|uniref:bile acid:sodium symporter n=1 Tax=Teichococcus oryzae TaxID=1608942 RepID=UPI001F4F9031|nr:bile acid:sodium symporter [Pseudoroseomonas oryzae]
MRWWRCSAAQEKPGRRHPDAKILFAGQAAGLVVLPLMLFHQIQLFACAILARRYTQKTVGPAAGAESEMQPAA